MDASDDSSGTSNSEESSSEDSDTDDQEMTSVPAKQSPTKSMFPLGEVILDF